MFLKNRIREKRSKTITAQTNLFRSFLKRFSKDESGAVTVEFVLWVPVFVLIMIVTVDASILLTSQANLWSIARDTSRLMAVGLYSDGDAENYALSRMPSWGANATINASRTANVATVNLSVPMASIAPFKIVSAFSSGNINVAISHHMEPR